ncbi:MAG TPA: hypothetical protein VE172_18435, partial [Stackebrandtia sp.]|uniref:hypothetical protein n=1 Tax=Stackebrandtia sp. TaxID=2023065 RepID=UPI002D3C28E7
MQTPFAAYLRVYEPLAAFSHERERHWREYAANGRAASAESGPGLQRELFYDAMTVGWDGLPSLPDEAYVIDGEDGPLICPWHLGPRIAAAVRSAADRVPPHLVDAFLHPRLVAAAEQEHGPGPDARGDLHGAPAWHEHIATWHVPARWFVLLDDNDRDPSPSSVLRYRVSMARARRRGRQAYGILQTSLGRSNPVAVGVRQLCEWLSVFHPRSTVEVDYGGLVRMLSGA